MAERNLACPSGHGSEWSAARGSALTEQDQPIRVGRRLAAIVAADVAGYSRLMGLDEVGTARALREHRKVTDALVGKHGGRLVKSTGDGVLLEFPSVVDAVECAVAVQALMARRNEIIPQDRRMLFRIGINLGDILIEGEDILGDGVNVAARLESIAKPGGICISSSAYDQVRGKVAIEFIDLGDQKLKISNWTKLCEQQGYRSKEAAGSFLAHRVTSRRPSNSVAFGSKQTLSKPLRCDQCRLTGDLVSPPAPYRMPVGPRLQRWPRFVPTHRFGVTAPWAEGTAVRRIERIGQVPSRRRQRRTPTRKR